MSDKRENAAKKDDGAFWFWGLISIAAIILFVWSAYAVYLALPHLNQCTGLWIAVREVGPSLPGTPQPYNACLKLNEFGDFLAGTFAPLAFLGLVITVLIQARELREQRKELAHSIEVAEAQKEEMAEQADFLGKQADLMAETAKLNIEQQARRDLDTLVEIARPLIQKYIHDGSGYNAMPDVRYMRSRARGAAEEIQLIHERLAAKDPQNQNLGRYSLKGAHELQKNLGLHLNTLKKRLSTYDLTLYVEYGFEDLRRELNALLEIYPHAPSD
jgi:hypothetical protein